MSSYDLPSGFDEAPPRADVAGALTPKPASFEPPDPKTPGDFYCGRCKSNSPWGGNEEYRPCDGSGLVTLRSTPHGQPACCPFWHEYARGIRSGAESAAASDKWPVPKLYLKADLERPKKGHAWLANFYYQAKDWVQGAGSTNGSLLLVGNPGCGKTWLAASVLNWKRQRGSKTAFATSSQIIGRVQATYSPHAEETSEEVLSNLRTVDMLVIDDWGKHRSTEHSDSILFDLIRARYNDQRPCIVTANKKSNAASNNDFIDAMRSSLSHNALILVFPDKDLRGGQTVSKGDGQGDFIGSAGTQ